MRWFSRCVLKVRHLFHSAYVKFFWTCQSSLFRKIGKNSRVLSLPYIEGAEFIEIGENFFCGKDVRLEAWSHYYDQSFSPRIIIGNNVSFTDRCYISCIDSVTIGDNVLLGREVFITDNSHGKTDLDVLYTPPVYRKLESKGSVRIGNNVWIGRQATILSGVSIGEVAVIGANSLVNKNIPAYSVAVGSPAEVIKRLNENIEKTRNA